MSLKMTPGSRVGPYEIQELLGSGGMGAVYRAHDPRLQRDVAIKVLSTVDERASARLLEEARAASALNHPNICTIHEVGEHDAQAFIVMEHIEGKPLSELIPPDGLAAESVISYAMQISDARWRRRALGFGRIRGGSGRRHCRLPGPRSMSLRPMLASWASESMVMGPSPTTVARSSRKLLPTMRPSTSGRHLSRYSPAVHRIPLLGRGIPVPRRRQRRF